jgi:hypothetical protein
MLTVLLLGWLEVFPVASGKEQEFVVKPMTIRRFCLVFGVSFGLATGAIAQVPFLEEGDNLSRDHPQVQFLTDGSWADRARGNGPRPGLASQPGDWGGSPTLLVAGLIGVGGLLLAAAWLGAYQRRQRWQRVELVRQEVKAFRERPEIKHVLDILDYEEYRTFYVNHPEDGRRIGFEASDDRLRRALRSHNQMVKMRAGLDEIKHLAAQSNAIAPKTLELVRQYDNQEFVIEVALRDWFDSFLSGLEYFETMIESGLTTTDEIKPFIIYWLQLIGDRRYRRKGGSGFYDQLFHYIHWAGYGGVQNLFKRFGLKILPPPYSTRDFTDIETVDADGKYDTYRALCLAKAAHLVYEDRDYVTDISRLWLSEDIDNRWMQLSNRQYVVDVIKAWLREGEETSERDIRKLHLPGYADSLTPRHSCFAMAITCHPGLPGQPAAGRLEDQSQNSPQGVHHPGGSGSGAPHGAGPSGLHGCLAER